MPSVYQTIIQRRTIRRLKQKISRNTLKKLVNTGRLAPLNLPDYLYLDSLLALDYRDEMPKIEVLKDSVK